VNVTGRGVNFVRFIVLGGSGSGKSTQAEKLCRHFEISLVSAGDILHDAVKNVTDLGRHTQPYLDKGELVPDEVMIELIQNRLKQPDTSMGWVLEGYPRTAFQAEELDFLLENIEQKLDWAIYLQVPASVMVSRSLGRSLPDDQPEIVQRRVEIFYDRTHPILEYYDRRRRLLTINGDQTPEIVHESILNLLSLE
jgi:adenylate kinase